MKCKAEADSASNSKAKQMMVNAQENPFLLPVMEINVANAIQPNNDILNINVSEKVEEKITNQWYTTEVDGGRSIGTCECVQVT